MDRDGQRLRTVRHGAAPAELGPRRRQHAPDRGSGRCSPCWRGWPCGGCCCTAPTRCGSTRCGPRTRSRSPSGCSAPTSTSPRRRWRSVPWSWRRSPCCRRLTGLAVSTKITFGLVGLAVLLAWFERDRPRFLRNAMTYAVAAVVVVVPCTCGPDRMLRPGRPGQALGLPRHTLAAGGRGAGRHPAVLDGAQWRVRRLDGAVRGLRLAAAAPHCRSGAADHDGGGGALGPGAEHGVRALRAVLTAVVRPGPGPPCRSSRRPSSTWSCWRGSPCSAWPTCPVAWWP